MAVKSKGLQDAGFRNDDAPSPLVVTGRTWSVPNTVSPHAKRCARAWSLACLRNKNEPLNCSCEGPPQRDGPSQSGHQPAMNSS